MTWRGSPLDRRPCDLLGTYYSTELLELDLHQETGARSQTCCEALGSLLLVVLVGTLAID